MRIVFRHLLVLALLVWPLSEAMSVEIEDFYGEFAGRSVSNSGDGVGTRDINVKIEPAKRGFTIEWSTVSTRADGKVKRKTYSIDFRRTKRDGIYGSAMGRDVFGKMSPLNPLKGDPYVWARLEGKTLSVYAMHIIENGSYEMQVYHRTLTDTGMDLEFSRYREGEEVKKINGVLGRVE